MTEREELKPCKCGLCGSENTEPLRGLTHCNDCMRLSEVMTMEEYASRIVQAWNRRAEG